MAGVLSSRKSCNGGAADTHFEQSCIQPARTSIKSCFCLARLGSLANTTARCTLKSFLSSAEWMVLQLRSCWTGLDTLANTTVTMIAAFGKYNPCQALPSPQLLDKWVKACQVDHINVETIVNNRIGGSLGRVPGGATI